MAYLQFSHDSIAFSRTKLWLVLFCLFCASAALGLLGRWMRFVVTLMEAGVAYLQLQPWLHSVFKDKIRACLILPLLYVS